MPAHGQDVWWKPLTDVPVTEPRWVRAVEMRPGTPPAARSRIMRWPTCCRTSRMLAPNAGDDATDDRADS